jgi:hypothetical protein
MRQIEIEVNLKLGIQTAELIRMYFSTRTVKGIEGFLFLEEELLRKYKNTYAFNNLRSADYYAVYKVYHCDNCQNPFEILINNRQDIYNYIGANTKICNACKIIHLCTERFLGFGL